MGRRPCPRLPGHRGGKHGVGSADASQIPGLTPYMNPTDGGRSTTLPSARCPTCGRPLDPGHADATGVPTAGTGRNPLAAAAEAEISPDPEETSAGLSPLPVPGAGEDLAGGGVRDRATGGPGRHEPGRTMPPPMMDWDVIAPGQSPPRPPADPDGTRPGAPIAVASADTDGTRPGLTMPPPMMDWDVSAPGPPSPAPARDPGCDPDGPADPRAAFRRVPRVAARGAVGPRGGRRQSGRPRRPAVGLPLPDHQADRRRRHGRGLPGLGRSPGGRRRPEDGEAGGGRGPRDGADARAPVQAGTAARPPGDAQEHRAGARHGRRRRHQVHHDAVPRRRGTVRHPEA